MQFVWSGSNVPRKVSGKFQLQISSLGVSVEELKGMAIWVVEFSNMGGGRGGEKLERVLPKNQHTQRKLLNFENWVNGEVSKSAKS